MFGSIFVVGNWMSGCFEFLEWAEGEKKRRGAVAHAGYALTPQGHWPNVRYSSLGKVIAKYPYLGLRIVMHKPIRYGIDEDLDKACECGT